MSSQSRKKFVLNIADISLQIEQTKIHDNKSLYDDLSFGSHHIKLVKFTLKENKRFVTICIPFYLSNETWLPFDCCATKYNESSSRKYFESQYGAGYIFNIGSYYPEPFLNSSNKSNYFKRVYEYVRSSDKSIENINTYRRFGNIIYLLTSYYVLNSRLKLNDKLENNLRTMIVIEKEPNINNGSSHYKSNSELTLKIDDPCELNYLLRMNKVELPNKQNIFCGNNLDKKFKLGHKLIQLVGEHFFENSCDLTQSFKTAMKEYISIIRDYQ